MITKIKRLFEGDSKKLLASQMKLVDDAYCQGARTERKIIIDIINEKIDQNDTIQMYNVTAKAVLSELLKRV